jgi:hypothetical protein
MMAGRRYDIRTTGPAATVALVVDDPEGDADGQKLRKVLARIDVAANTVTVRRVPVWRCYTEPDLVVAELTHESPPATQRSQAEGAPFDEDDQADGPST